MENTQKVTIVLEFINEISEEEMFEAIDYAIAKFQEGFTKILAEDPIAIGYISTEKSN